MIAILLATPNFIAADEPAPPSAPDITGCWSGMWMSCKNNHKGPLSAKICKVSDTCYEAHFRGRFWAVVPFRYTAQMQVIGQEGDRIYLSSSRRLPLLGTFEMTATVTACDFTADYTSRNDRGQFVMKRN